MSEQFKYRTFTTLSLLLFVSFLNGQEKMNISEIISNDNPAIIKDFLKEFKSSGKMDYTTYVAEVFYPRENLDLKLFGVLLNDVSVTFIDEKASQILMDFDNKQSTDILIDKLNKRFGKPVIYEDEDSSKSVWRGDSDFEYMLTIYETNFNIEISNQRIKSINKERLETYLKATTIDNIIVDNNPQLILTHRKRFDEKQIEKAGHTIQILYYEGKALNNTISLFDVPVKSIKVYVTQGKIFFLEVNLEVSNENITHIIQEVTNHFGTYNKDLSNTIGSRRTLFFSGDKTGFSIGAYLRTELNDGYLSIGYVNKFYFELMEEDSK